MSYAVTGSLHSCIVSQQWQHGRRRAALVLKSSLKTTTFWNREPDYNWVEDSKADLPTCGHTTGQARTDMPFCKGHPVFPVDCNMSLQIGSWSRILQHSQMIGFYALCLQQVLTIVLGRTSTEKGHLCPLWPSCKAGKLILHAVVLECIVSCLKQTAGYKSCVCVYPLQLSSCPRSCCLVACA